ncbi:MAG: hypothetical protein AVDCRST_MAG18-1241, partial [uncultured Thermomicrobiales bacterium]
EIRGERHPGPRGPRQHCGGTRRCPAPAGCSYARARLAPRAQPDCLRLPILLGGASGRRPRGGDRLPAADQSLPALRRRRYPRRPAALEPGLRGARDSAAFPTVPRRVARPGSGTRRSGAERRDLRADRLPGPLLVRHDLVGEYRARLLPPLRHPGTALAAPARGRPAADRGVGPRADRDGLPDERRSVARRRGTGATRDGRGILAPRRSGGDERRRVSPRLRAAPQRLLAHPEHRAAPARRLAGGAALGDTLRAGAPTLPALSALPARLDIRRHLRLHLPAHHLALPAGPHPAAWQCAERLPLAGTARLPRPARAGI